jgi:hypothetical protein
VRYHNFINGKKINYCMDQTILQMRKSCIDHHGEFCWNSHKNWILKLVFLLDLESKPKSWKKRTFLNVVVMSDFDVGGVEFLTTKVDSLRRQVEFWNPRLDSVGRQVEFLNPRLDFFR